MTRKPKILILSTGLGHKSMAEAAAETYRSVGIETEIFDLGHELKTKGSPNFNFIYEYFPFLMDVGYEIGKSRAGQKIANGFVERERLAAIQNKIEQFKPKIVLSTLFSSNWVITKLDPELRAQFLYLYLTHEPWADHPILYSKEPDLTFVYDRKARRIAEKYGVPKNKIKEVGWLIRPRFYQASKEETQKTLKELKFKEDVFTILICAGSGTVTVLKILPALFQLKNPTQVIFVSGSSKATFQTVSWANKILNQSFGSWKNQVKMKIFGFTDKLDKLMRVSNLVIGKAGPQLLLESVATRKPFFAISHFGHHQDSILKLIKKKKLGFVEEKPKQAINLLLKISRNRQKILRGFGKPIERERNFNFMASEKIVKETLKIWQNWPVK